jgi:hypothetical protein
VKRRRKGEGDNGVQGPLGCRTDTISPLAWPYVKYWGLERCRVEASVNYTHSDGRCVTLSSTHGPCPLPTACRTTDALHCVTRHITINFPTFIREVPVESLGWDNGYTD